VEPNWTGRYKVEDIMEVGCPKCGARPHKWCDRSGDKLSRRGKELLAAGTPPHHQERMWIRQGHLVAEFPSLLARQRPGRWDESAPRPGKSAPRRPNGRADRAARRACQPCANERAYRTRLNAPGYPVDFPCRHPAAALWQPDATWMVRSK
jgi:hypothetical protein